MKQFVHDVPVLTIILAMLCTAGLDMPIDPLHSS